MFKPLEKADFNQISLTGLRAIVIIGLLSIKPLSFDEIREALLKYNIIDQDTSKDILRIDINTIKAFGCKIGRPSKKNNFKYILSEHPFSLKIKLNEINILKKIYASAKQTENILTLINIHELFAKLAFYIKDEENKEKMLGISNFKQYNIELIKELYHDCLQNKIIEFEYKKPSTKNTITLNIYTQELIFKNNKLYVYGYDIDNNLPMTLNFKRIIKILSKKNKQDKIQTPHSIVKFLYKDLRISELEKNEKIIKKTNDGYIVAGTYHNDFLAMQRILYFADKCIVLEPENFKQEIIEKIKQMRKIYD